MIASDCDSTAPSTASAGNQALRVERQVVGGAVLIAREVLSATTRTAGLRLRAMRTRHAPAAKNV